MKKWMRKSVAIIASLAVGMTFVVSAQAGHDEDDHSDNIKLLKQRPILVQKDDPETKDVSEELRAESSDLAFQGKLVISGAFQGIGISKILPKKKGVLKQISFFPCNGGQGDVSVYGDLVVMSVDSPRKGPGCDPAESAAASQAEFQSGSFWEGIRIISIADPTRPKQVAAIQTPCGSHTNTIVPDGKDFFVYVQSYPITQAPSCNTAEHQAFSVVEVDAADPAKSKIVSRIPSAPDGIGCHDITVNPERDLAVAACLGTWMTMDISNPAEPKELATVRNEAIELDHSSAITWDGKIAIIGDEHAGAAGGGGCSTDSDNPVGSAWFYDISDPEAPVELSNHSLPRVPVADTAAEAERFRCTTHNFNVLPMKDPSKYIMVISYYSGGIAVLDFSDPTDPQEIGHYVHFENGVNPDVWSSYWYNGRIYTTDFLSKFGVGVYKVKGTGKRKVNFFGTRLNPQVQLSSSLFDPLETR
jgi:hypothetical protein